MDLTVHQRPYTPAFQANIQNAVYTGLAKAGIESGQKTVQHANKESMNLLQHGSDKYIVNDFLLSTLQKVEKIRLAIEKHAKALPDDITIRMNPEGGFIEYGLRIGNVRINPITVDSIVNTRSCANDLDRFQLYVDQISSENSHFKPQSIIHKLIDRIMESEDFGSTDKARKAAKKYAKKTGSLDYYYRSSGENPKQTLRGNARKEAQKQQQIMEEQRGQIKKDNNSAFNVFSKYINEVTKPGNDPLPTYLRPVEETTEKEAAK